MLGFCFCGIRCLCVGWFRCRELSRGGLPNMDGVLNNALFYQRWRTYSDNLPAENSNDLPVRGNARGLGYGGAYAR